jgi:hypothetical protein
MEIGLLQGRKLCQQANISVDLYDSLVHTFITNHSGRVLEWIPQLADARVIKSGTTVDLLAQASQEILKTIKTFDIDPNLFDAIAKLYVGGVAEGRGEHDSLCVADLHATDGNE